jgi:acyl-CoA synthetase (AMP-forming)/AMP-acid ligase II
MPGSAAGRVAAAATLGRALATVAAATPRRPALISGTSSDTYAQLDAEVTRLAAGLRAVGLNRGERVALVLPNGREAIRSFFATVRAGGVAVPVNPGLKAYELERLLCDARPAVVLASRRVPGNDVERALAECRQSLTGLRHVAFTDAEAPAWAGNIGQLTVPPAASAPDGMPGLDDRSSPDGVAAIFYTTGTTGTPKGVMHSHRGLLQSFAAMQRLYDGFFAGSPAAAVARAAKLAWRYRTRLVNGIGPQTWMTPMPTFTIAGFRVNLQALLGGHRLVLCEQFHPRQTLELIQRERVSILAVTPTMAETMLSVAGLDSYDLSSLLVIGLGAAPTAPMLARRARARFGCAVAIGYGSTETAGGVLVTRLDDRDEQMTETVGRPFPGVAVRLVDDERRDVATGCVGELACQTPGLMLGYHGQAAAPDVLDDQGWYYTGDLAVMDAEGYVRIVGRKRDVMIRGGQNVVPAELERVLLEHAAVAQAAVVGVPDWLAGERIWAFVVPAPGPPPDASGLRAHCAQRLEPHKLPDEFRFRSSLPVVDSGEVCRQDLRGVALAELLPQSDHDVRTAGENA